MSPGANDDLEASMSAHMRIGKVGSYANFQRNRWRSWLSLSMSKIWIQYIVKFLRDYLANDDR